MGSGRRWLFLASLWVFGFAASSRAAQPLAEGLGAQETAREGRDLYNQGKLDEALAKFNDALKIDAGNTVALQYVARIDALQGRFKKAIDVVRSLQREGVSIITSPDSQETLNVVAGGILSIPDLKQRADLLVHLRETLPGLPSDVEHRIDSHLMAIYAKMGEVNLHEVVKARYFRSKPVPPDVFFTAGRTYLEYGVKLRDAASYFEQAVDFLRKQEVRPSGNPERDNYIRRRLIAESTAIEDFLAYTYHIAKMFDPSTNRLIAAEPQPGSTFTDVTEAAGLKDVAVPRVAVGDFDNDGFEDLCLGGRIFRNEGGKTFVEVTKKAAVEPGATSAALWVDYDNDGHLDLLCCEFPRLRLWRNRGNGTFEDVTAQAGLGIVLAGAPEALAAADYDGDGYLDLFLGSFESPAQIAAGQPDFLFRNTGKGSFEDVSKVAGIRAAEPYCARGCAWGDFNNDGLIDLYVANYRLHPNQLWVNQGNGKFLDQAEACNVRGTPGPGRFAGAFGHSVGCVWGDTDSDGDLDLVVTNLAIGRFLAFADAMSIYINGGQGKSWRFEDVIDDSGVRFEEMATGVSLCDYDNDGDLDLYISSIYKERPTFLYQNEGKNKFRPVTWRSGALAFGSWSHAWFDKDNDGDMDLIVAGTGGTRVFENQAKGASWLRVRLVGKTSNRQGIGARITVAAGPLQQIREVAASLGTGSQDSPVAHFGLGQFKGLAKISVRWPNGRTQPVPDEAVDQLIKIEER